MTHTVKVVFKEPTAFWYDPFFAVEAKFCLSICFTI